MPRARTLSCALALTVAAATSGCTGKSTEGAAQGDGRPLPVLQGKTIDGDYVQLADFRGQVVLVNVWATWCEPCRKELPELARLHRQHAPAGFTVLGVSVDKVGAFPMVRRFIDEHALSYPMVVDPDGHAVGAFEIKGYPTSLLIGRDGALRWRRDGIIRENDGELGKQIEAALEQPAPPP